MEENEPQHTISRDSNLKTKQTNSPTLGRGMGKGTDEEMTCTTFSLSIKNVQSLKPKISVSDLSFRSLYRDESGSK